ncbi:hypothetical protein H103_01956 [Trichophyton rubrum CBS 288.86]|nr:hypothetical protein H100_01946 [Trichophyton rubrum MR850]EZF55579.1 hypothetical protein H103_01956 [Trichophyton rubrum CBS 288.86]EZF66159.1 hypothetical protein H104_01931 [Trichophyton rubrum CBS 289.86]EZF87375.1 hypothetical protein H110_01955 [Trichophyton rubrum MR1448]
MGTMVAEELRAPQNSIANSPKVMRFFSGGCVPIMSNAVASIVSNVFHGDRARSIPICLYVTTYLVATSIDPVIGASILQSLSWRCIGHIELIFTAAFFPLFIIGLPETRGSAILRVRAKRIISKSEEVYTANKLHHDAKLYQAILQSMQRPLYMLFTEPVVFIVWAAFSLGTVYLFTQSVELVYGQLYGWDAILAGYVQIAIVFGEILGCGLCMSTKGWYYASADHNTEVPGTSIPEARLYTSIIGGFFGVTG